MLPNDLLFKSTNYRDSDFCLTSGFLSISKILIKLVDVTITKNSPFVLSSLGLPSFSSYLISLRTSPLWLYTVTVNPDNVTMWLLQTLIDSTVPMSNLPDIFFILLDRIISQTSTDLSSQIANVFFWESKPLGLVIFVVI